jgi:hypothetical protein
MILFVDFGALVRMNDAAILFGALPIATTVPYRRAGSSSGKVAKFELSRQKMSEPFGQAVALKKSQGSTG